MADATDERFTTVATAGASIAAIIAVLAVVDRIPGISILPLYPPNAPPAAGWVGLLVLLIAIVLLFEVRAPESRFTRRASLVVGILVVVAVVATLGATMTGSSFDIEKLWPFALLPPMAGRSTNPLGIPTLAFLAAAIIALGSDRWRRSAGAFAVVPACIGGVVALSQLYEVPLLLRGTLRPVSLWSALATLALGIAAIAAAGPASWPTRILAGPSVRAQLSRWFLPLTVLIVIGTDVLTVRLFAGISPAFGSLLNTVLSVAVMGAAVYAASRVIGGRVDRAEEEATGLNRLYVVVTRVNELILRAHDEFELLDGACRIIVDDGGFAMAWAGSVNWEERRIDPMSQRAGSGIDVVRSYHFGIDDDRDGQGPSGDAARTGIPFVSRNIAADSRDGPWRDRALAQGYRVAAGFPITTGNRVTHTLAIYARDPQWFNDEHIDLLVALASDLSFAMEALANARERASAEARLVESEAQFRSLIESSSDLITIVDGSGSIRYQSPSAKALLGFAPDDWRGGNVRDLIHPEDLDSMEQALGRAVEPGAAHAPLRCRMRHKNGTWRVVEVATWNMVNVPGVSGLVIHARDVTDRQVLEEQLRQAQKMEAVGMLASGIAHDFNNILSVIMANAGLLDAMAAEAHRDELRDLQSAAERGKAMIQQLMGISRVAQLAVRPADLGQIAERVAGVLRRILPVSITVDVVFEGGDRMALVDPSAVEQILLNLATNARDAMPGGGDLRFIVARSDGRRRAGGRASDLGRFVSVSAQDTGTGMTPETRLHVFDPFFTTKPPGVGTGLGMAMVQDLMTQHGGFVDVESELGHGTTVRLVFPGAAGAANVASVAATDSKPDYRGHETVLIVDDEEMLRRVAKRILESRGYTVIVAEDGEAALRLLHERSSAIDLVFTDLVMPRMGGGELYRRASSEIGAIRFLVASGYARSEAGSSAGMPSGIPFISKPWTMDELLEGIRSALDGPISSSG
ncbi:MAG TPA: PAS domain S-box protein [Gemmatimonadales bacterium]|jgi:PAS domain S-box-containing protein